MDEANIKNKIGPVSLPLHLIDDRVEEFVAHYYETSRGDYITLEIGDLRSVEWPLVRIQSACSYGHFFDSMLCDCEWQLQESKRIIVDTKPGIILFALDQHGKGVGIKNHFRIYAEAQRRDCERLEARRELGFLDDCRDYAGALVILREVGLKKIKLLTNNPHLIDYFQSQGIVVDRISLKVPPDRYNSEMLTSKRKLGYFL